MSKISVIAGTVSVIISIVGLFLAIRTELKKHNDSLLIAKIEEEKRYSRNEQRLALAEQRIKSCEAHLTKSLDEINSRIDELFNCFFNFLKELQ